MPVKAPPRVAAPVLAIPFSWTGFYVGLNAGGSLGTWDASSNTPIFGSDAFTSSPRLLGAVGGGQAGFNWQFAQWVIGIEADIQATSERKTQAFTLVQGLGLPEAIACDDADPSCTYFNRWKFPWFGTVRGRLGFAADRWLFYATGGYAYGEARYDVSLTQNIEPPRVGSAAHDSAHKSGWTAGGGVEAAISSIWSVKLEYLYVDLGTHSISAANTFGATQFISDTLVSSYHIRDHILRLGVNLRFGAIPSPVMAKY
jgi:outer membrane immunogenic protein